VPDAAPSAPAPAGASADAGEVPVLEVRDVRAGYGDFDVIDGVSFSIAPGEVFALLGPNGAGKSTTLRVIAGLLEPSGGTVSVCGRNVVGADADALSRAGLCTVPEGRGIFPNLTVAENLWMATFTGTGRAEVEELAYSRFPRLSERRTQTAGTMSGGEQQMLAMARALATSPALLVLDELSMGLAPLIVEDLYGQVAEIARSGLSILVVEQFAHEVLGVADTAAIMLHGRIARVGAPASIAAELESAYLSGAVTPT
jgi:branched-chain amino acid transport system ATP-binding protein